MTLVLSLVNKIFWDAIKFSLEIIPNRRYVQCGGCRGVFHGNTICLGASGDELKVLLNNTNNAIKYR